MMDVRIVLLPDPKASSIFESYSKKINENFDCIFELGRNAASHITLLHAQIPNPEIKKVEEKLKSLANSNKEIYLRYSHPEHGKDSRSFIGVYFKKDAGVVDLREDTYQTIKGSIESLKDFKVPHVTLTKIADPKNVEKAIELLSDFPKDELVFDKIAICETGENGTARKTLASFELGK